MQSDFFSASFIFSRRTGTWYVSANDHFTSYLQASSYTLAPLTTLRAEEHSDCVLLFVFPFDVLVCCVLLLIDACCHGSEDGRLPRVHPRLTRLLVAVLPETGAHELVRSSDSIRSVDHRKPCVGGVQVLFTCLNPVGPRQDRVKFSFVAVRCRNRTEIEPDVIIVLSLTQSSLCHTSIPWDLLSLVLWPGRRFQIVMQFLGASIN